MLIRSNLVALAEALRHAPTGPLSIEIAERVQHTIVRIEQTLASPIVDAAAAEALAQQARKLLDDCDALLNRPAAVMPNILIIDDDEGVGRAIADLLRDEGYDVELAADGRVALDRLTRAPLPSLILLDLMMPGMDGLEFRLRQLADDRISSVPVIVMSARPDVALQAKQLLVDDFLPKPMNFEKLLHLVQKRAVITSLLAT